MFLLQGIRRLTCVKHHLLLKEVTRAPQRVPKVSCSSAAARSSPKSSLALVVGRQLLTPFAIGTTAGGGSVLWYLVHHNEAHCYKKHHGRRKDESLDVDTETLETVPLSRLWDLVRPDAIYLFLAIASALVVALLNIQIPLELGNVMNILSKFAVDFKSALAEMNFIRDIKRPAFRIVEMYGLQSLFTFIYISSLSVVGERMASRLREQLFHAVIRQDIEFFDRNKTGRILSRLTADVQDFKSSFKSCISQGLRSSAQTIGCVASLLLISPKMTLLMASVVPSIVFIGAIIGTYLRKMSRDAQEQVSKSAAVASEAIGNVRTVRAFAMEDRECEIFNEETRKAERMNMELGIGIAAFQGVTNLALNGIVLGTLLFGGYLLSNDEIRPGDLMSFLVATQTVQRSLAQLSLLFGHYIKGMAAGGRIFSYMDMQPKIAISRGLQLSRDLVTGRVKFDNVTFSYPTRKEQRVLKNFTLTLEPGQITAICGLSGGGKSTMAALLERFYDVEQGSITVDGYDIRSLDASWLRGHVIGFISQEPVLFSGTIKENIRFGKPDATDEEVIEAAKLANCDTFIRSFPQDYDTQVGERGFSLSGGQKQRVAIARAIIKNPTILILDEATSALDAESESIVQNALETVMKGRTVLVIAHRLSTIQMADQIAVLAGGRIVERGTHKELTKMKGIYYQLTKQQQSNSDD